MSGAPACGTPARRSAERPKVGQELLLTNRHVTTTVVEDSCVAIEAGPGYTVANDPSGTGDVTFRAATRVVLKDGFAVESGARFTAIIDPALSGDVTRSYQYQDVDYFLEQATGPWGTLSWEYDKIGNRESETDFDGTDDYHYILNTADGHTARLASIDLSTLGTRTFGYSLAGHQTQVAALGNVVDLAYDAAGRLSEAKRNGATPTPFLYDGRSFLRHAGDLATTGTVQPLYDSAGLLHGLLRQPSATDPTTRYLFFHLAGRPVAQLALETGQPNAGRLTVYTISPSGIWKYDPMTGRTTQEEPSNWTKGPKERCKEQDSKPCEGLSE